MQASTLLSGVLPLAVAAGLLAGVGCSSVGAPRLRRDADQHVLLVTIDTLRADSLGAYGGQATTPVIDSLAAAGVRFDFAHAHAVTTLPSHASLLTGLNPFQHAIHANAGFRLLGSIETLATRLRPHGFATAAFIGGFPLDSRFGLARGFDRYDDELGPAAAPGFLTERPAEAVVGAARTWIEAQRGRWFVWIHLFDPHAPYRPPASWANRAGGDGYLAEVAYVDHALGPLFEALREQSGRRTLVILTADHGEALGDHGELTHGVFAYEATLRVPLIVAQLGGAADSAGWWLRGRQPVVRHDPVRHIDVVPTVLDALEIPVPADLPGRSLLSAGHGDRAAVTYFEALEPYLARGWAPLRGVLVGREKFVELPLPELYDLAADPAETRNLVGVRPEHSQLLAGLLRALGPAAPPASAVPDAETRAQLGALGYASGRATSKPTYGPADDPKHLIEVERMLAAATARLHEHDLAGAIAGFREANERRPGMRDATAQLAFLYWQAGETAAALKTLRPVVTGGAADAAMLAQYGSYLAESGHPAEAIALLEPAARADPPDLDVLNALGAAYLKARRHGDAIAVFEKLIALDPEDPLGYENLAAALLERGDPDPARRALERALGVNPRATGALVGLGAFALRAGDAEAAAGYWRRALAVDPDEVEALYNLGLLLAREGRREDARPYLERFLRVAPAARYRADLERVRALLGERRD